MHTLHLWRLLLNLIIGVLRARFAFKRNLRSKTLTDVELRRVIRRKKKRIITMLCDTKKERTTGY